MNNLNIQDSSRWTAAKNLRSTLGEKAAISCHSTETGAENSPEHQEKVLSAEEYFYLFGF